jgi:FixJ family two-component response regulator
VNESGDMAALVCVVDDDDGVRDSFRTLLESLGFAVTTYACGRDILADERRHQARCVIVDQHMPEMDGLATLGALRREGSGVPTILISGRLDAEIAARAAALDVAAILEKPLCVPRLLELIRTAREPTR